MGIVQLAAQPRRFSRRKCPKYKSFPTNRKLACSLQYLRQTHQHVMQQILEG